MNDQSRGLTGSLFAENLWADMHKGSMFKSDGRIVKHTRYRVRERLIYEVAAAIGNPENHRMPLLGDLFHNISSSWQKKILQSLAVMRVYLCYMQ